MTTLQAPYPFYGGKSRFADAIWQRFGAVDVYSEPFCGSAAVLLAAPRVAKREIVADTNGFIVNFWRAVRADPTAVAYHADYPTFHHDLTARHQWLVDHADDLAQRLLAHPSAYDAKIAGWWVWGISNWIGGEFCAVRGKVIDKRPHIQPGSGSGRGVNAQRADLPIGSVPDIRPFTHHAGHGGQGVQVQRQNIPNAVGIGGEAPLGSGERLVGWFAALARRLAKVIVLHRDWKSAVSANVLAHKGDSAGVFLDPPYKFDQRADNIYTSDADGPPPADAAFEWALEHGSTYRVAYACMRGDYDFPSAWECVERPIHINSQKGDQVWFSPTCVRDGESVLGRAQAEYAAAASDV